MTIPSFSHQSTADSTVENRPTTGATQRDDRRPVSARGEDATTTNIAAAGTETQPSRGPAFPTQSPSTSSAHTPTSYTQPPLSETQRAAAVTAEHDPAVTSRPVTPPPAPTGPKPRASLLATLGLILGVAGALLVLSGPLTGYGIGVAGLALVLSLAGIFATRKRHVAGKSDALIGAVLSITAIVVGILALTGQLSWLGTDMQPATDAREWLDAQFENRF